MTYLTWIFFVCWALSTAAWMAITWNRDTFRDAWRAEQEAHKQTKAIAARDKADAARLRHSNKTLTASNEALRAHTAEHCQREAALKAVLQAAGWAWVDVAPEHVDVSDLDAAVSPADISWVPGQRDGGAS
jgi:hypothetical protein